MTTPQGDPLQEALALHRGGRLAEAKAIYEVILKDDPDRFEALNMLGAIALQTGNFQDAVALIERAIAIKPAASAYNNLANALLELRRADEALANYDMALALDPTQVAANCNRGNVLLSLRRPSEALASYDRALALKPDLAEAHNNRGNALRDLSRTEEALVSYDAAISQHPGYADAHVNRGHALQALTRPDEALVSFERARALNPNFEYLLGIIVHLKMKLCAWEGAGDDLQELRDGIAAHRRVSMPFALLSLFDDPRLHRRATATYSHARFAKLSSLGTMAKHPKRDRIRVGYYSADFREHPMAYLFAEMFESHDRALFEVIGFSIGPTQEGPTRARIAAGFDRVLDVQHKSDREVAQMSRELEIDIAVDLNGHTQYGRPGLFVERCAPVQIAYLGYPGTMGMDAIDYVIADRTVIPEDRKDDYAEKVVYMPLSYQVNDSRRSIPDVTFVRAELGLPDSGFVFCCFNNAHEILPPTFDIWMRLLKHVPGSVLWLLEDNPTAAGNLRKEAEARGVRGHRLIFARRMPHAQHMARHAAADLFLDTLPYNAHTTASDALWAGLPLLTCPGNSFASRVAASLLTTLELPELIASSAEDYEAKALVLATDASRLTTLREKLAANRRAAPLFDGKQFTRDIEAAYAAVYQRYQAGLPPDHIRIGC